MIIDGNDLKYTSDLLAKHLPGNDIGMMLHVGNDDLIAFFQEMPAVRLGNKIEGFCRTLGENDLFHPAGMKELPHHLAGKFKCSGCLLAKIVYTSMQIGNP